MSKIQAFPGTSRYKKTCPDESQNQIPCFLAMKDKTTGMTERVTNCHSLLGKSQVLYNRGSGQADLSGTCLPARQRHSPARLHPPVPDRTSHSGGYGPFVGQGVQSILVLKEKASRLTIIVCCSIILSLIVLNCNYAFAKKITVITTSTDLKSIAEFIGGDKIKVESITKGYQNPHIVDPKPSYMLKLHKADLFVKVGLDLELWAKLLEEGARNPHIRYGSPGYVDASIGVELLEIPQTRVDRSLGDIHVFGNPHYWLDPLNGKIIAQNILEGLKRISPENANYFEENKKLFDKEIDINIVKWLKKMKPYSGAKIIAYHKTWPNFAKRFGINIVDYVEPKPGIPPSPSHTANLIRRMKLEDIKLIIKEPFYENKIPRFIASKTGARVLTLPTSVEGTSGIKDYFALFDYIIDELIKAFKESGKEPNDRI